MSASVPSQPRIVHGQTREPAASEAVQAAVAGVADGDPTVPDQHRDNRRPHSGVVRALVSHLEHTAVGKVDGGAQAVAGLGQTGLEAKRPASAARGAQILQDRANRQR